MFRVQSYHVLGHFTNFWGTIRVLGKAYSLQSSLFVPMVILVISFFDVSIIGGAQIMDDYKHKTLA